MINIIFNTPGAQRMVKGLVSLSPIILSILWLNTAPIALASNEYWVGASGDTNSPTSGTWTTTTPTVWSDGAVPGADVGWTAGNAAIFGGVDSQNITVTVGGAISMGAGGMLFNNSGYTLSAASPQTITGNAAGTGLFVAGGKTATIGNNVKLTTSSSSIYMDVGASTSGASGGTVVVASGGTLSTGKGVIIQGAGTEVDVQSGGTLSTPNASSSFLAIGNGSGDNSSLVVNGGTASIGRNSSSIWLGGSPTATAGARGTLTINSGAVTEIGGFVSMARNLGDVATLNLNGGTLTTAGITTSSAGALDGTTGAGTSTVNFNGGTLKAQQAAAYFLSGVTAANVRNGGALINNNGFNVTIEQALLHSSIGGDNATDGGLISSGSGSLTLSGANTYSGNTVVSGGTLTLGNAGKLTYYIGANGVNNQITGNGTGTLLLNGTFAFDLSGADDTVGNNWLIVDEANVSTTFGGTFAVSGFTQNGAQWTSGNYLFDESSGILSVVPVPEPGVIGFIGLGAGLLLMFNRRKLV